MTTTVSAPLFTRHFSTTLTLEEVVEEFRETIKEFCSTADDGFAPMFDKNFSLFFMNRCWYLAVVSTTGVMTAFILKAEKIVRTKSETFMSTIVTFFDGQCGYYETMQPSLQRFCLISKQMEIAAFFLNHPSNNLPHAQHKGADCDWVLFSCTPICLFEFQLF